MCYTACTEAQSACSAVHVGECEWEQREGRQAGGVCTEVRGFIQRGSTLAWAPWRRGCSIVWVASVGLVTHPANARLLKLPWMKIEHGDRKTKSDDEEPRTALHVSVMLSENIRE